MAERILTVFRKHPTLCSTLWFGLAGALFTGFLFAQEIMNWKADRVDLTILVIDAPLAFIIAGAFNGKKFVRDLIARKSLGQWIIAITLSAALVFIALALLATVVVRLVDGELRFGDRIFLSFFVGAHFAFLAAFFNMLFIALLYGITWSRA
jgi:hypothetical protein